MWPDGSDFPRNRAATVDNSLASDQSSEHDKPGGAAAFDFFSIDAVRENSMILLALRLGEPLLTASFALAGRHPFRCRYPESPHLRLRVGYLRSVMSPAFCLDFDFICEDFLKNIEDEVVGL